MWPRLLPRYITAELLKVFLSTLTVFTFLITLAGVANEAVRQGLGPLTVLRLIPYTLPNALVFALPGTILFSACSVFGRLSASNELTAIKSLGISPAVVIRPALLLAFLVSLGTVWLIDIAFTWGYAGIQRVVLDSAEEIAYSVLRTQRTYRTKQFSICVARVVDRRLLQMTITLDRADGETMTMTAREARLRAVPEEDALKLTLTDGSVEIGKKVAFRFQDTYEHMIPLTSQQEREGAAAHPAHMRLCLVGDAAQEQRRRIRLAEESLAGDAAEQLLTGNFAALTDATWSARLRDLDGQRQRLHRLETEPFRRWASGFSCLAFVLVGAPLAIRMRNSDLMTTFGICFLPILIVYYPLFAYGLDRAKNGGLPPYCVWLGNLVCFAIGAWLLRKVRRY
ncbi:MAG: LptF/LptG family permease [Pirellulaceae bacterium]|nr:LptF/LptG family permease [Pirellulaceae bacterium]